LPIIGIISRRKHISNLVIGFFIIVFSSFIFFPNQIIYLTNKNSGNTIEYIGIELRDESGNIVKINDNRTTVLDFWTTSCSVCFEKFPEYEKVYNKYLNEDVDVYSVNVPQKNDVLTNTFSKINDLNYDFQTLYLSDEEFYSKKYNIFQYPHILIIRNRKVVYSGSMVTSPIIFVNNLYSEINNTLLE